VAEPGSPTGSALAAFFSAYDQARMGLSARERGGRWPRHAPRYGRDQNVPPRFDILLSGTRAANSARLRRRYPPPVIGCGQIGGADAICASPQRPGAWPAAGGPGSCGSCRTPAAVRATLGGTVLDGFPGGSELAAFEFSIFPAAGSPWSTAVASYEWARILDRRPDGKAPGRRRVLVTSQTLYVPVTGTLAEFSIPAGCCL